MTTEQPTPPPVVLSTALLNPLPCPFCGHVGLDFREGTTFRWIIAKCGGCGATRGETCIQTLGQGTKDEWMQEAQQDAIAIWNTRFNVEFSGGPLGISTTKDGPRPSAATPG